AAFSFLDELPRLPSGKVDRSALGRAALEPGALTEQLAAAQGWVPPRDPTEELLAGIWEEVLAGGVRVGVHDDFFELGGHSLLATQVISRIRDLLGVELALRSLFENPTVADLATHCRSAAGTVPVRMPPIEPWPRDRGEEVPLSFAQQRLWFLSQLEPEVAAYNIPIPLRLRGPLDRGALEAGFCEIVRRHEVLRTRFAGRGEGEPRQVICEPGPFPLPGVDLTRLDPGDGESEIGRLARDDAARPFDLERDRLLRGTLLGCGPSDHVLLLSIHHVVTDGWSTGVFLGELSALYGAFSQGRVSPLPALPIQYADFACWQRRWLRGEVLEAQLAYWRERLAGIREDLELPTDR
ncbi:MAG: non-ribosomal peptide synthetase, partial [bacterium]|nr:non-ribosomal peptide synthetase [bacterium]